MHLKFNGWQNDWKIQQQQIFCSSGSHAWMSLDCSRWKQPRRCQEEKRQGSQGRAGRARQQNTEWHQAAHLWPAVPEISADRLWKRWRIPEGSAFQPWSYAGHHRGCWWLPQSVEGATATFLVNISIGFFYSFEVPLLSHDWRLTTKHQSKYEQHFQCPCVIVLIIARNFETSLNLHLFVLIFAWWGILNRVKPL